MTPKKIPMRKCLGCGEMFPQKELVRVVKTKIKPENENEEETYEISLDLTAKQAGRGAYICKKEACLESAFKKKQLDYAFKEKLERPRCIFHTLDIIP